MQHQLDEGANVRSAHCSSTQKQVCMPQAREWHPDLHPAAEAKAAAEGRFKECKRSFDALSEFLSTRRVPDGDS